MEPENTQLVLSIQQLYKEIDELQFGLTFIQLLNKPVFVRKAKSIQVLQILINRHLQYGNYRSVLRYFLTLRRLVLELKPYDVEVRDRITAVLLK